MIVDSDFGASSYEFMYLHDLVAHEDFILLDFFPYLTVPFDVSMSLNM